MLCRRAAARAADALEALLPRVAADGDANGAIGADPPAHQEHAHVRAHALCAPLTAHPLPSKGPHIGSPHMVCACAIVCGALAARAHAPPPSTHPLCPLPSCHASLSSLPTPGRPAPTPPPFVYTMGPHMLYVCLVRDLCCIVYCRVPVTAVSR